MTLPEVNVSILGIRTKELKIDQDFGNGLENIKVSKLLKGTPPSFEISSKNTREYNKDKEQSSKCNSKQIFGKLPKFQQRGRVLAKALQKEKGCKVRGGEGLLYLSKALNFP